MARNSRILLTASLIAALAIGVLVYQSVRDRGAQPARHNPTAPWWGRWCVRTVTASTRCPTAA